MLHTVVGLLLAVLLLAAAGLKLAAPRTSVAALATFGVHHPLAQRWAWVGVVVAEVALAVTVGLGIDLAAWIAAGLMLVFAGAQGLALARGRRGAPCACFGARSTVSPGAVVRDLVLGALFVALPFLPDGSASTSAWLGLGLGVCALAVMGLAVAVLALAREVGVLRMAIGPQQALEIPDEGPAVGDAAPLLLRRAPVTGETRLALAVFRSEGCRLCQAVAPAVAMLAREDDLAVVVLDEVLDAAEWRAHDIPGSPFAVALDPADGTVLAKGTFNGLGQLESVLATAQHRASEVARAASAGPAAPGRQHAGEAVGA